MERETSRGLYKVETVTGEEAYTTYPDFTKLFKLQTDASER